VVDVTFSFLLLLLLGKVNLNVKYHSVSMFAHCYRREVLVSSFFWDGAVSCECSVGKHSFLVFVPSMTFGKNVATGHVIILTYLLNITYRAMSCIACMSVNGVHALLAIRHFGGYKDILRIYFIRQYNENALHVRMDATTDKGI